MMMPLPAWAWIVQSGSNASSCGDHLRDGARRHGDFDDQRRIVGASPAPRSANSICCFQSASASGRIEAANAHAAALPQLVLNLVGEPVDFGFGAFNANDEMRSCCGCRLRIAGLRRRNLPIADQQVVDRDGRRREVAPAGRAACSAVARSGHAATTVAECFRQRFHFERQLRDDAERAERAGEQFAEVVAGDVFHHAAAAFERHAAAVDRVDADHVVANRAVAVAPRAVPIRGHDAADRRLGWHAARRSAAADPRRQASRPGRPSARRPRPGSSCRAACSRRSFDRPVRSSRSPGCVGAMP